MAGTPSNGAGFKLMVFFLAVLVETGLHVAAGASTKHADKPADKFRKPTTISVWWTPELRLKSLGDVPEQWSAPFDEVIPEVKFGGPEEKSHATSCESLVKLRQAGFSPNSTSGLGVEQALGVDCILLRELAHIRMPRTSFFKNFVLSESVIDELPPAFAIMATDGDEEAVRSATANGKSWHQFDPELLAKTEDGGLTALDNWSSTKIRIVARGDFNGDGVEDLILRSDERATAGSYSGIKLFMVTRTKRGGRLQVISRLQ